MSRYIDADALAKAALKLGLDNRADITTLIEDQPTADVVEVVRCKDCAYSRYVDAADTYRCDRRGYYAEELKPDDYCSRGERREQ